jgi:hypothetical protein
MTAVNISRAAPFNNPLSGAAYDAEILGGYRGSSATSKAYPLGVDRSGLEALAGQVPALDIDFTRRTIVDRIVGVVPTFTRPSSSKLCWNGTQFEEFPADVPGFELVNGVWQYVHDPAATNNISRSHQPIAGSWSVASNTYAEGVNTALDGITTSWTSTPVSSASALKRVRNNFNTTTTGQYCGSWFVKYVSERYVICTVQDNTGSNGFRSHRFDLLTGTADVSQAVFGTATGVNSGIIPYGNGWFRVWVSGTLVSALTQIQNILHHDTIGASTSVGVIEGWVSQLEQGLVPTSPIITTGSAVTRSADTFSVLGLTGTTAGVIYIEGSTLASGTQGLISLNDNTANERLELITSGTDPVFNVVDGGVSQSSIDGGTVSAGTIFKAACAFEANNFAISVNGGVPVTDTSGTVPTFDRMFVGRNQAGNIARSAMRRLMLFPGGTVQSLIQQLTV